jgi:hypothetical protein
MAATGRNLQAQPKILKKSSKHQINQSERKFFQKNYVSYHKSVKEPIIRISATRRNLQAQPKMLKKKCRNIKSTNLNKNFPKKTMFRTIKV